MKSICVRIVVMVAIALSALICSSAAGAPAESESVRVRVDGLLRSGTRAVVLNVYATPEGGAPISSERREVRVDERGTFAVALGAHTAPTSGERWLAVEVPPVKESRRIRLTPVPMGRRVMVNVGPVAAISADGFVESTVAGFRFPDGTIQTSAATVTGGVPSVNGISSAVTIAGAGTASVQTAGNTITINGPAFGTPVAIGTTNAGGTAVTVARADHVHAHGNQSGGSLHAAATTGSAGFLSASDKVKLDATVSYIRTIVVSPIPGDPTGSGNALLNALSAIAGNSASSPFLLKIEPGVYDIGATALTMKTFVDVEGSGENATFIVASRGNASLTTTAAAVIAAANAELRQLSVTNTAPGSLFSVGFFTSTSARLRDVTIHSTGATQNSIGVFATSASAKLAISRCTISGTAMSGTSSTTAVQLSTGATVDIQNSNVTGKGIGGTGSNFGVSLLSSSAKTTIDGCTILSTGTGGQNTAVSVAPGTATILNSIVQAETNGSRAAVSTSAQATAVINVFHSRLLALSAFPNSSEISVSKGANSTIRVAASQVDSSSTGTPKCVHVYDDEMNDLNNSCPAPPL